MRQIGIKENIDRRYLGAVCFVDSASKGIVRRSFNIETEKLSFFVNPSFLHVITSAAGLEDHLHSFASPPDPPPIKAKFCMIISDPLQKYLPRIKWLELPRNPDPDSDDSLFKPIRISMFSSSIGSVSRNWSVIRASVFMHGESNPEQFLKGALLRIVREDDGKLIASSLTDHRGEAVVVIPGIPLNSFVTENTPESEGDESGHDDWLASGNVVEKETSVRLEAIVDRTFPWPVDPELLEEKHNEWLCKIAANKNDELADFINLKLKTGQTQITKLYVNVPDST